MNADRLYHGGVAGLHPGDLLVPSPPHVFDGCPICRARAAGRVFTVGDYRAWLTEPEWRRADPAVIAEIREVLDGVPDEAPIDAPSADQAVYVTSSELYATWYAARSGGDLYRVKPLGRLTPSREDHFDSFTIPRARVLQVVRRSVVLTPDERAELMEAWTAADLEARGDFPCPHCRGLTEHDPGCLTILAADAERALAKAAMRG